MAKTPCVVRRRRKWYTTGVQGSGTDGFSLSGRADLGVGLGGTVTDDDPQVSGVGVRIVTGGTREHYLGVQSVTHSWKGASQ